MVKLLTLVRLFTFKNEFFQRIPGMLFAASKMWFNLTQDWGGQ